MDKYEWGGIPLNPQGTPEGRSGGRALAPPKALTADDLFHISDWPGDRTEFDDRRGVVLFHDPPREFLVGYSYAQIKAHRQQGATPMAFRRLVSAALHSTRISHEVGGDRVRRTWRSPFSVHVSR